MYKLIGIAALAVFAFVIFGRSGSNSSAAQEPEELPPSRSPNKPRERHTAKHHSTPSSLKLFRARSASNARNEAINDGTTNILTTALHLWMLDLTVGDFVAKERLKRELDIEPTLGCHRDRSMIRAILVGPNSFYSHESKPRVRMPSNDYGAAGVALISKQAVPVLSSHNDEWRFEGFFRLSGPDPATNSFAFDRIVGAPPELLELRRRRD